MKHFKLGTLSIEAQAYGSQGNAILGIRDSGKTYTATEIAEKLFDAGIPFITFDPTGVWRWLRVPGKGRGYPIVVAGGEAGDLPLTVTSAVEIVRAAMKNGVSIVLDLTGDLSKADWRRIVKSCITVLLKENAPHGLRHVFIEEAAEFAPQRVIDGDVYAVVEKLARIGGNARLGYTLINQRSQEVNKAVLELCENLFLHRQKGKNAIQSLDHWLDVAGVDKKALVQSLPRLPSGECWAWMGGAEQPELIKVPPKNSFHPDRRTMHGAKGTRSPKAVDVGSFVKDMKSALVSIEAELTANDPKALRAELDAAKRELTALKAQPAAAAPAADPDVIAKAEERGFERGKKAVAAEAARQIKAERLQFLSSVTNSIGNLMTLISDEAIALKATKVDVAGAVTFTPERPPAAARAIAAVLPRQAPVRSAPAARASPPPPGDGTLTNPQLTLLRSLAWWRAMGHAEVSRPQAAAIAGWRPSGSNLKDRLSELSRLELVTYPRTGYVSLTAAGVAAAPDPDMSQTLVDSVRSILTGPQLRLYDALPADGGEVTRQDLAAEVGWEPTGSNLKDRLSELSRLEIVSYPQRGTVQLQAWVRSA